MRRSRKRGRRKYGGKPPKPTPKPKREATSAPILALPTELLAAIFSLLLVPDVCRTVCRGFSEAVRMIPFVAHEWQLQMVRVWNQNDFRYTQDRVPPSLRSHFQPRRGVVVSFDPQLAQLLRAMHAAKIDLSRFFSSLRTKKPVEGREPPTDPFRDAFCGGIPFPSHKWFDEPTNAAWFAPFDVTARGKLMDLPVFGSVRHTTRGEISEYIGTQSCPGTWGRISNTTHMQIQLGVRDVLGDGGNALGLWRSAVVCWKGATAIGDIQGTRNIRTHIAFGPEINQYICPFIVGDRMGRRGLANPQLSYVLNLNVNPQPTTNPWLHIGTHNQVPPMAPMVDEADQTLGLPAEDSDDESLPDLVGDYELP